MAEVLTQQELYDIAVAELEARDSELTDTSEGSMIDIIFGVASVVTAQMSRITVSEFSKTFFDSANGPEVTGGSDDLEALAVDHFGDSFARPEAQKATGVVTFSRPNTDAGDVTIPAGTEVGTDQDSNGERQIFVTTSEVVMDGTTKDAQVEAQVAGVAGNVLADKVINVISTLTDSSVVVTNDEAMSGGTAEETDAQYRETIRNLLQSLKGATLSAIESTALAVPGVQYATAVEIDVPVIEYDIGGGDIAAGAEYFRIPYAYVYIADANGESSDALIETAQEAVDSVRAAGVKVQVLGATAIDLNWTVSITLNPSGPNFATLSDDATQIEDSMRAYIANLSNGTDFVRSTAEAAILAIWGPAGTDDITAISTSVPVGSVDVDVNEKLVPGTMEVA